MVGFLLACFVGLVNVPMLRGVVFQLSTYFNKFFAFKKINKFVCLLTIRFHLCPPISTADVSICIK